LNGVDADFIGLIGRLCAVVVAATAGSVRAEVITDGSIGPRVRLSGDFEIGAELGQRAGRNLFHSFERFSLEAGERATFSGPAEIRNLISRVTGAARSEIDGTLRSTIPGADFFFLNPAGVVFGLNARLDLKGSFHVSTADELRFADGATFSATNPAVSSFTVAAPAAFGFLRPSPAPIMVDSASLAVPEGQSLSLVGGDVDIRSTSDFADNLIAPGGRIDLVSAASAGEVVLETEGVDAAGVARFGSIRLSDSADVDATGPGGGSVQIRGGEFVVISNSTVFADNTGPLDATGGIAFDAETVTIGSGRG
jgi:filamentous hemagglutinin family protein